MMWGEGEGERLDGRREGGHSSGSFSLLAPPSASRLTQQFFSPSKGAGPVANGGHIPAEFLRPPQQTFGAQLFGGASQVPSVHEEIDIKPVILPPRPASPPPTPTDDTDDIDVLMDDLLKDVEEDVTAHPKVIFKKNFINCPEFYCGLNTYNYHIKITNFAISRQCWQIPYKWVVTHSVSEC